MPPHAPTTGERRSERAIEIARRGGAPDFDRARCVRLRRDTGSLLSYDSVMS
jgi:hypothetical protein